MDWCSAGSCTAGPGYVQYLRKTLVLWAKYRSEYAYKYGTYNYDTELVNVNPPYDPSYTVLNSAQATWGSDDNVDQAASITDTWLATFDGLRTDKNTAKQNGDILMTYSETDTQAVHYCRSIFVNGIPCDLPNIQTLARIYCDANAIDSIDPTASSNLTKCLGTMNPNGAWTIGTSYREEDSGSITSSNFHPSHVWSSSEFTMHFALSITKQGRILYGETVLSSASIKDYNTRKGVYASVVPVLEL